MSKHSHSNPSWRQRQKDRLHETIFETALDLFRRDGYENTSVQRITEEIGIAKGTFFNHFPAKENVIAEWYLQLTFDALLEVKKSEFSSAENAVCALSEAIARRAADDPDLVDVKTRIVASTGLVAEAERTQDQEAAAFFGEHLEDGKASGELAADLDVSFFSGLVISVLTGTSRSWVQADHGFDLARVCRERISFLFRAAQPQLG